MKPVSGLSRGERGCTDHFHMGSSSVLQPQSKQKGCSLLLYSILLWLPLASRISVNLTMSQYSSKKLKDIFHQVFSGKSCLKFTQPFLFVSFIHPFSQSGSHSVIHPFSQSVNHSFSQSFSHLVIQLIIPSVNHSFIQSIS